MKERQRYLKDELAMCSGKTVFIGMRSSFFYVGPAEEAIADMDLLGIMSRCSTAIVSGKADAAMLKDGGRPDISCSLVKKAYPRSGSDDEFVIVVEGRDPGAFWTRDEYLSGRRKLVSILGCVNENAT
jgi:hypothetical protein